MFVHAAQDTLEYIRTEGCMDPTEVACILCFVSISIFSKRRAGLLTDLGVNDTTLEFHVYRFF
ncbi:hypothetical protein BJX62DRAFT_196226 [Aspergillus germanicus]